jgi:hypothetical protein
MSPRSGDSFEGDTACYLQSFRSQMGYILARIGWATIRMGTSRLHELRDALAILTNADAGGQVYMNPGREPITLLVMSIASSTDSSPRA